jgi:Uma2 family endonuclease
LIEVWCLERGVEFRTLGSWTIKDRAAERGAEPDECYVFGDRPDAERPDLAVEVVWTHGGLNKLEVYRKLGVAELWTWAHARIQGHVLRGDRYEPVAESAALPGLDVAELASFIDRPTTSAAIREYRARLAAAG